MSNTHVIIKNRLKKENLKYTYFDNKISYVYKKNNYELSIKKYPFAAPKHLKVNNKNVDYAYINNNYKFYLKKYFKIECLCCESILCENNWNIHTKFSDISKEYEHNLYLIKCIKNFLLIEKKHNEIPNEIKDIIMGFLY